MNPPPSSASRPRSEGERFDPVTPGSSTPSQPQRPSVEQVSREANAGTSRISRDPTERIARDDDLGQPDNEPRVPDVEPLR